MGCFATVSATGNHGVFCNRVCHRKHGCFVMVSATGNHGCFIMVSATVTMGVS